MAKKKEVIEEIKLPIEPTPTPVVEYPHKDKVLEFREKGFDNNRIAALLGIQKHFVDGIK